MREHQAGGGNQDRSDRIDVHERVQMIASGHLRRRVAPDAQAEDVRGLVRQDREHQSAGDREDREQGNAREVHHADDRGE
ncbi:MAG: hypothetical protein CO113_03410 [Elusimicrobia bacterium CG_4_9_14_3_um_filter_62_55]|nr:MAG: hypothetical protein COR54_12720 [Elusimicrobia bacterium CG22_combo_CG10-13_8_21_14_all_63_91]PJA15998.1 MAG: hypothetical protein COX66_08645 [Elusimicrobia bacterium CG_4_10_14_0_2_um_filter_63_34]PJB26466.1 MAG: hypothetical protein CO113_03410 [Elusimicrobia bacterium CG_4_9_14_3_um_filter_62_55]